MAAMILNAVEMAAGNSAAAPAVCLLHGLFGRLQNLGALARLLAADFRVISLDLRNHGGSGHAPGMSYVEMAEDVLATLAAHGALPARVVGHSMGGKVAMVAALTRPEAVVALVVADIAPVAYRHNNRGLAIALRQLALVPGQTRAGADEALTVAVRDAAVRAFLLQNLRFGDAPAWRIGLDEIIAGMADIEGFPDLPTDVGYQGPALFVRGDRSDYVVPGMHAGIRRLFPAAGFTTIAEAGHWLHADQPDAFGACVRDFFLGTH